MSALRSLFSRNRSLKKASPTITAARAPWVRNGIDYGPARAAIQDLASWACDIADRAVADWPDGRNHVRKTRRYVEGRIAGKTPGKVSVDDVMFTAQLLVRIFDEDLELGISEMLTIFDLLDLPHEVVPVGSPSRKPRAATSVVDAALASIHPFVEMFREAAVMATTAMPTPVPLRLCVDCGYVHEPGEHVHYSSAA